MYSGIILEIIFSDLVTVKFSAGFLGKTFLAMKAIEMLLASETCT